MTRTIKILSLALTLFAVERASAQEPFTPVVNEVNKKMVKLFGAGGFKGLPSYGTGILVSPQGHILTVNNHILTTQDLRVHVYDGRLYHAKVVAREPGLDVALVKIIEDKVDGLPYFDFAEAAKGQPATPGTWILAFSNQFLIGTREEKMTVQKGVVSAITDLRGRKGVFEAPFSGEVYFGDSIFCNPGAAGGAITTIKGRLIGVIGREIKNTLTDTWINYAVPIHATTEVLRNDKPEKVDMATFVRLAMSGKYGETKQIVKGERGGYTGIALVANAVSATPAYIEEVIPASPAAQAGLRPDDLIVYVNGELVPTINMYRNIMKYVAPGTEIDIDVQRYEIGADGQRQNRLVRVKLKVAEQPKTP